MPFLHSSAIKPIFLPMPILLMSFLLVLSQVSVAEGRDYCEGFNEIDRLTVAVPGNASFKTFVNITPENPDQKYSGFCIDVFSTSVNGLDCELPYTFVEFYGTYDDLVKNVTDKTYSVAAGDITILADRWEDVVFTVPFTESGLTLVVPARPGPKGWIFLKPFSWDTWLTIAAALVCTMFTFWFLEHREPDNTDFSDPRRNVQFGNALWFTFSSLFLAHREKIQSNYSRIVAVAWLFLALVLTQTYTANLTTMLTNSRLQPKIWSQAKVGCDENTFIKKYVQDVLHFKNVITIKDEYEYLRRFSSGDITAAYLESPYAKVFTNKYCGKFIDTRRIQRFGGFGFIFGKDHSPLAAKFSKAILQLSEDGLLTRMERYWLTPNDCSESMEDTASLSLRSLWGLFVFSIGTSIVCFLLCLGHLLRNYLRHQNNESGPTRNWMQVTRSIARYFWDAEITHRSPSSCARVVHGEAEIRVEQQG
ncbi:hypothetical protein RHMOL_Rhmol13G0243700 [Rhododendron molle]|uniref:Uncharacterized protein n=1 Tax=Rhododendron molle TaxID=49168 RepID=A0ACC0LBQ8_RHOML|nr:hypothetical protein RHMOL_Rhmol13G0243700 [Rhododendron molle]